MSIETLTQDLLTEISGSLRAEFGGAVEDGMIEDELCEAVTGVTLLGLGSEPDLAYLVTTATRYRVRSALHMDGTPRLMGVRSRRRQQAVPSE